ncbi:MAG: hypothetical protein ACFFD2_05590 [Promethearchaeota archaeon]
MAINNKKLRIIFLLFSIIIVSFLMKYFSEWTHEFLGHCGFGWIAGGTPQNWYVSWFWPIEFGYASVSFPIGTGNIPRAITIIGGITTCLIATFTSHSLIFTIRKKKVLPKNSITTKKLIIFHCLFWYGFWAFANSVGYLILGGLINFGDIQIFRIYTGTPSWIFITLGFISFIALFYLISYNSCVIFRPLLPNTSSRKILIVFWLIIPFIFILMLINPAISVLNWMIPAGIGIMIIPSLLMFFLGDKFLDKISWEQVSK